MWILIEYGDVVDTLCDVQPSLSTKILDLFDLFRLNIFRWLLWSWQLTFVECDGVEGTRISGADTPFRAYPQGRQVVLSLVYVNLCSWGLLDLGADVHVTPLMAVWLKVLLHLYHSYPAMYGKWRCAATLDIFFSLFFGDKMIKKKCQKKFQPCDVSLFHSDSNRVIIV